MNTLRMRFQRLMVDISRAVESSCNIKLQHFVIFVQSIAYPQSVPNAREWIWNYVKDVHALAEEWYVIVNYISMIELVSATR